MTDSLYICANKIKKGDDELLFSNSKSLTLLYNKIKSDNGDTISFPLSDHLNLNSKGIGNDKLKIFPNKNIRKEKDLNISGNIIGINNIPNHPTIISVIPGNKLVSLSWSQPNNGGSDITFYKIYIEKDNEIIKVIESSLTHKIIDGLSNGTYYTFSVSAVNIIGESSSSTRSVTTFDVPSQPTISSIPGNGLVSLSWAAPSDNGGSPITGYKIIVKKDNQTVNTLNVDPLLTQKTVDGLSNGTQYTFYISSINIVGESSSSSTSITTNIVSPSQPTITSATPGNGSVSLSWSPPDNGGSPITGYNIVVQKDNQIVKNINSSLNQKTIDGLLNGTYYTFSVSAINIVGESSLSSISVTTNVVSPSQPTITSVTPGNGLVSLSWSSPSDNGGSPITGYNILVKKDNQIINTLNIESSVTQKTIDGLSNGSQYTFYILAFNNVGEGSSSSISVTTNIVSPSQPNTSATPGDGSVSLSWAVLDNGGSPIIAYKILVKKDNQIVNTLNVDPSLNQKTINGLSNGTLYSFYISAVNSVGEGSSSSISTTTNIVSPSQPTITSATPGNGSVSLSWSLSDNGGSPITVYKIVIKKDTQIINTLSVDPSLNQKTIDGLSNGSLYTFYISAINNIGEGSSSSISVTTNIVSPSQPINISLSSSYDTISVEWFAPLDNGGSPITGYKIVVKKGTQIISTTNVGGADDPDPERVMKGLMNELIFGVGLSDGDLYTLYISAINIVGESSQFSESSYYSASAVEVNIGYKYNAPPPK